MVVPVASGVASSARAALAATVAVPVNGAMPPVPVVVMPPVDEVVVMPPVDMVDMVDIVDMVVVVPPVAAVPPVPLEPPPPHPWLASPAIASAAMAVSGPAPRPHTR